MRNEHKHHVTQRDLTELLLDEQEPQINVIKCEPSRTPPMTV
jgi:hypothetical protein